MISFHFSIFEPLETAFCYERHLTCELWLAFILVSLNHWKQLKKLMYVQTRVVISFHFSIFEPLETAFIFFARNAGRLWLAFILVSLNHWKQLSKALYRTYIVVISFHFSIFEPLETAVVELFFIHSELWLAFILVSLNHWKQRGQPMGTHVKRCD